MPSMILYNDVGFTPYFFSSRHGLESDVSAEPLPKSVRGCSSPVNMGACAVETRLPANLKHSPPIQDQDREPEAATFCPRIRRTGWRWHSHLYMIRS
jgi:hypothetical protein